MTKDKQHRIKLLQKEKTKNLDYSHRVTSIYKPKQLDEQRNKLELDELAAKIWNPNNSKKSSTPGLSKEFYLPKQLQEMLHSPIYEV